MSACLLLNADARPISMIPMSTLTWQESCKAIYTGHAEPLHFYENWVVHSQKIDYRVPTVMILKQQVQVKRTMKFEVKGDADHPQSHLVFLRDGYVCQYCSTRFPEKELTVDHVLPKKHGGKTRWENVSTSCSKCNGDKGCNLAIVPKNQPFKPSYSHLVKMMKKFPIFVPHETWNYYLGWNDDLLKVVKPSEYRAQGNGLKDLILSYG